MEKRMMINMEVKEERILNEYKDLSSKIQKLGFKLWSILPQLLIKAMRDFIREHKDG